MLRTSAPLIGALGCQMLRDGAETFELGPEDEAELLQSVAAIERGDYVSGDELLNRLRRFG